MFWVACEIPLLWRDFRIGGRPSDEVGFPEGGAVLGWMVDRHYSCVLVGGVASESRVLLARGTMAVLANWGQSGLLRRDPFPVSAKIVAGCWREERRIKNDQSNPEWRHQWSWFVGLETMRHMVSVYNRKANISMVGVPRMFTILLKTSTWSLQSVELSKTLDARSAITLISPGVWLIESHMFLETHHSHICLAVSLHGREWEPPMWRTYATAVELSVLTLIWSLVTSLQRDCKPKRMAFSSK